MNRYICLHGHFYQPPRENPWLESVELQDSAYPYHDWNSRISAECYAPNSASRILSPDRKIIDIVNNYSKISFNFGPTLLAWLEKHHGEVYQAILDAERKSRDLFSGHGSAIAQAYNHMILPLASRRDKQTQVLWGIRDFERRFMRAPEGMWLPETAVDLETLEMLARYGIKFTVLAPRQARRVRAADGGEWREVQEWEIDPRKCYRCNLPSGDTIALFFYDGAISQELAFGKLLENGEQFARRLCSGFDEQESGPQLVHVATDGETYGHHHRFGDMALAYCIYYVESHQLAELTIYGEYLEKYPPRDEVEIHERSSWSCIHGLERWRGDCGCNSGMHPGWHQTWRAPLRGAMDWLRGNLDQVYEEKMRGLGAEPWETRDRYIEVILGRSNGNLERFIAEQAGRDLTQEERIAFLKLQEMQRHAMLMYTSCGWFFDELSGIETIQVMHYAARAIQLAEEVGGIALEAVYVNLLRRVPSNLPEMGDGGEIFSRFVQPAMLDLLRVGVHYAVSSLFKEYPERATIFTFDAVSEFRDALELGRQKLVIGRVFFQSCICLEENVISFAVLHLGDHNIIGGAREFMGEAAFSEMHQEIKSSFTKGEMPEVIFLIDKHFQTHSYSLWHLFRDEQREILNRLIGASMRDIETAFRQIYEHHYPLMQALEGLKLPLPRCFSSVLELVVNREIHGLLEDGEFDEARFRSMAEQVKRWSIELDKPKLGLLAGEKVLALMEELIRSPEDTELMARIAALVRTSRDIGLGLDLWKVQNLYFGVEKKLGVLMRERSKKGMARARQWMEQFSLLGDALGVKIQ